MNSFIRLCLRLTHNTRIWYKPDPFTDVCIVVKRLFGKMYHNGTWMITSPPEHFNCRCNSRPQI